MTYLLGIFATKVTKRSFKNKDDKEFLIGKEIVKLKYFSEEFQWEVLDACVFQVGRVYSQIQ